MSYVYFLVQLVCMAGIIFAGDFVPDGLVGFALITAAAALMVWALLYMRLGNLHVLPELKHKSVFVTSGPYRVIRHPMYAASMLAMIGFLIDQPSLLRGALLVILVIDLYLKMLYEERQLIQRFSSYRDYMKNTKRFIPFVF
ncbi:methyltransferase family protein [Limihaloglobus sulfuriphilus]|nr:isoprenylcysteine carboxylmethyltransferase family protein [Limihaloglobus sulfuriphilus]